MILLLDSTVLIDALRDSKSRRSLIHDLAHRGERLATSAMNVGEIYGGMLPAEERITEALLGSLEIYPIFSVYCTQSWIASVRGSPERKKVRTCRHDRRRNRA